MNLKFVDFKDVSNELWDQWVFKIGDATYLHASPFLRFLHELVNENGQARSFACIENEETPLAICPLGISENISYGRSFFEASWNGAPIASPAFASMRPSLKGKVMTRVYDHYHDLVKQYKAERCYLRKHAINLDVQMKTDRFSSSQLELLRFGYECQAQNTLIIELEQPKAELELQLSRYQRKHLNKAVKQNLTVKSHGTGSDIKELKAIFLKYQEAHARSAGMITRPQATFDLMLELLRAGSATLFVTYVGEIPISFLYCGEFGKFAYGWSQANLREYVKEYSPRQVLEWEAMLYYKERGFKFYEVGTILYGPQPYKIPSEKELSISEFKRRYGGVLMPELFFEKIFNKELWQHIHSKRVDAFMLSDYFDD